MIFIFIERWVKQGALKLRTAFSRDQQHKVYVQDLLRADADELWKLLSEHSAHFYVCGDAKQMASDVHQTLIGIAEEQGQLSHSEAVQFISSLESLGRYQKDVWIA